MKIMTKKILREIWKYKFRSLLIVTIILTTVSIQTSMRLVAPMIDETYYMHLEQFDVADGRFRFNNPINSSIITDIKDDNSFQESANIDKIAGRIIYNTHITYDNKQFQAIVIGVTLPLDVNKIVIERLAEGYSEDNVLDDVNNCLLEIRFGEDVLGQDVQNDENITVRFPNNDINYKVKGLAKDVDFLYAVDEMSKMPLMGQLAVLWVNLNSVQNELYDGQDKVNQVLFTVHERFNKDMILNAAEKLTGRFATNGFVHDEFLFYNTTIEYDMYQADVGSVDRMGVLFALIGLIVCSIAIFNTLSKIVQSQRKNIGLFLAMGAKKREILLHYMLFTIILSVIGIILGLPIGYLLAIGMLKMVTAYYTFDFFVFPIAYQEFIYAFVVTLAATTMFSLGSAWTITTITPREAMTATFTRIKVTGRTLFEKIFGWIPLFNSLHMLVPLREVFLKRKRSLVTILALTTSMIFMINSIAMQYQMYDIMVKNFDEYNTYDIQVVLNTPAKSEWITNYFVENNTNIKAHEVLLVLPSKLIFQNQLEDYISIICYQENSTMRNFNIIKERRGETLLDEYSILIGNTIAGKYNIKLNDEVTIGLFDNYTVNIGGIVGESVDTSVFWTLEAFYKANITSSFLIPENWVNGFMLQVEDGINKEELRKQIENRFDVAVWVDANIAKESLLNLMRSMIELMFLFLIIGIVMAVLFSFNSMYVTFMDRTNDFIAFKSMGTNISHLRKMIFWENAILSIFSLIITIPVGYLSYRWSINYLFEERFYIPMSIPWFTWPLVLAISLLSIWLATFSLTRRIKKMQLIDELRQTGV